MTYDWSRERFETPTVARCVCGCGQPSRQHDRWLPYDLRFFHAPACVRRFTGQDPQTPRPAVPATAAPADEP